MERGIFLKILAALTLAAVVFFSLQLLDALDRLRFAVEGLSERVAVLETRRLAAAPADRPAASSGGSVPVTIGGGFANLEFFDPAAVPGGRMTTSIGADPGILNPLLSNEATAAMFAGLTNASLAERNYGNPEKYQGVLAESWEVSPDHLTYRVKLRDGIFWQDFTDPESGREYRNVPVTAADFKFYIDVILNPDVNCAPYRQFYAGLERLDVISDREFVVVWREPYFRTFELTMGMQPLPRHLYWPDQTTSFDGKKFNDDHRRNEMLVGCGPYRLKSRVRNQRTIFERNDRYIGTAFGAAPSLQYLDFEVVPHANTAFQMLLSGGLDWLKLSPDQWRTRTGGAEFAEKNGRLRRYSAPQMAYRFIGWNMRRPLFASARVRTALTMLVDREKILNDVYYGLGRIVSGPFYIDSPASDPAVKPLPFDPERARELLAAEGWRDTDGDGVLDRDGKPFEFVVVYPADAPSYEQILTIVRDGMAKAGVVMKMQAYEWSVMLQKIDGRDFDAAILGWQMSYEQDPYQLWHSSQSEVPSGSNFVGFQSPEGDRLIEAIRREFDPAKRNRLCNEFHRLIHAEQPYTFLIAPDSLNAVAARYRNFRIFDFPVTLLPSAPLDLLWTPPAEQLRLP